MCSGIAMNRNKTITNNNMNNNMGDGRKTDNLVQSEIVLNICYPSLSKCAIKYFQISSAKMYLTYKSS